MENIQINIENRERIIFQPDKTFAKEKINTLFTLFESVNYKIYDASEEFYIGPLTKEEFEYYNYHVIVKNFIAVPLETIKQTAIPNKTSLIVNGRNDGYKEPERFIMHLKMALDTFDEVNYVDWNSPTRSFLYEVIDKIPKTGRLKHFVISPEYVNQMYNDPNISLCNGLLANNLALRRTDADWIVMSATDIIVPTKKELQDFINTANKYTFYTISRRDIDYKDALNNYNNLDEYREELRKTTSPRYFPARVTPNDTYSIFNCCGDFQMASRNLWNKIKGFEEGMLYACFADTNAQKKAVLYGFSLVPVYDIPLYHMSHKGMANDGSSPSKKKYNDAWEWVEYFEESKNDSTWGFSDTEIEYEII